MRGTGRSTRTGRPVVARSAPSTPAWCRHRCIRPGAARWRQSAVIPGIAERPPRGWVGSRTLGSRGTHASPRPARAGAERRHRLESPRELRSLQSTRIVVCPVLEQHVAKFVGERAALSHRVRGARDADEHGVARWVAHRQAVFVRADVEHGHVDPGRLLDDRHKITQRLHAQVVFLAEPRGGGPTLGLGVHDLLLRIRPWRGWPGRPGSRPAPESAAALRACDPCSESLVARAAHCTRSATVPVSVSWATVCPVAHAIATSSGIFATRSPEMIRDKVGCEIPVASARARWLRPAATRARSTSAPASVAIVATLHSIES